MAGFDFFMVGSAELAVSLEHSVRIGLMWIGFGAVVGIGAQIVLPGGDARPAIVTVLIGLMGAVIGPLGVDYLMRVDDFKPMTPLGFGAATLVSFCLLVLFRTTDVGFRAYVKYQDEERKRRKKRDYIDEE